MAEDCGRASDGTPGESAAKCGLSLDLVQLVTDHHGALYRYAFRLTGSTADAEDLRNLAHRGARGHLQRRLLNLDMRPEGRLFEQRTTTASTAAARWAAWRRVGHLIAPGSLRVDDDAAALLAGGRAIARGGGR